MKVVIVVIVVIVFTGALLCPRVPTQAQKGLGLPEKVVTVVIVVIGALLVPRGNKGP